MAIQQWHPGQLVVAWIGAVFVEALIVLAVTVSSPPGTPRALLVARALLSVFILIPFAMLAVTWRWFGARPRR